MGLDCALLAIHARYDPADYAHRNWTCSLRGSVRAPDKETKDSALELCCRGSTTIFRVSSAGLRYRVQRSGRELGHWRLAAIGAIYAADQIHPTGCILAALLIAFAVSLDQLFVFFVVVLFIADFMWNTWSMNWFDKGQILKLVWDGALVLGGVLLYALIEFGFLQIFHLKMEYIDNFYKPEFLLENPLPVIKKTLIEIWQIYGGYSPIFLNQSIYYVLLMFVCIAVIIAKLYNILGEQKLVPLILLLCTLGILITPFLQYPLSKGYMPYRVLVGVPVAAALFVLFACEVSSNKLRSWVLLPLALLVMVEFSLITNRQYYGDHWAQERDKALGNRIISRISEMWPNEMWPTQTAYTIAVLGDLPRRHSLLIPDVPSSTLGASFFEWDGGNSYRVAHS